MLPDMELEEPCRKAEMRRRIKLTTRRELTTAISQRYRTADRTNKKLILDEFTKVTGYHRKHAIRILTAEPATPQARPGARRIYQEAEKEALIVLWEAADRIWTECVALPVREQTLVVEAVSGISRKLPFPLLGVDTDNDSAFLNDTLFGYCSDHGIVFTRSRAYHKNDQAWVEQKNGAIVRKLVGYGRLEGLTATAALRRLYEGSRLYINFFQPSFKLSPNTGKERESTRNIICRRHRTGG
jgi:hypothetical protein